MGAEHPGFPVLAFLHRGDHDTFVAERGAVSEPDPQATPVAGVQGLSDGSEEGGCGFGAGAFAGGLLALLGGPVLLADGAPPGTWMCV